MYKDEVVTISEWYKGMTKHPIMGFGLIQNAEVFENKGLAIPKRGMITTNKTANALPIAYVADSTGIYHATSVTASGRIYKNGTSAIVTGLGDIYDIKIYKNYLWVRYQLAGVSNLGAYGPLTSGSAQWFPAIITTFTPDYWGQMVVGQDDFLYSTNGNYVAKIEVTASGVVGVAPTLAGITSVTALDLPDGQFATCITEYGTKIAIGTTSFNGGGRVYTWNRQFGTLGNSGIADLPIVFDENGVFQLYSHKNKLYVTAGRNGNIYLSDGTNYRKLAQIPFTSDFPFVSYYPNAITASGKGTILIGNVSTNGITQCGVWEITDGGEVVLAYALPTGTTSTSNIGIGFVNLNTSDNNISAGWYNGNTQGIDESTGTYADMTIESPLMIVGKYNFKKTFEYLEWLLSDVMSAGGSITVSYRRNKGEAYTAINTWDFATLGAISSYEDGSAISDCEKIQFKIETEGNINLINMIIR